MSTSKIISILRRKIWNIYINASFKDILLIEKKTQSTQGFLTLL